MVVHGPAGERERNFPTASSPKDASFGTKDVCKQHGSKTRSQRANTADDDLKQEERRTFSSQRRNFILS
jgi:hypothetical protein